MRFHGVFVLLVAVVALNECQAIDPIDRAFLEEWMRFVSVDFFFGLFVVGYF
jgi:hypothetical protein